MQFTNLSFPPDYLYGKEDELFNLLTNDYEFRCDNYAVAYQLIRLLDKIHMCEHSSYPLDDCFWPFGCWIVFITCRPKDIDRIKCIAKCIPSSIPTNIKIYDEDEIEI